MINILILNHFRYKLQEIYIKLMWYSIIMNILAVETSCDETALSIISADFSDMNSPNFKVLSDLVISQIEIHIPYGGVFPALAKREHAKNLVPLLRQSLNESLLSLFLKTRKPLNNKEKKSINEILEREPELFDALVELLESIQKPNIDMIMVTHGPGLAPALWVGVNFARALSIAWDIPIIPVNHMEGHISSILLKKDYMHEEKALHDIRSYTFPMISLLISGGHTQIILVKDWGEYEIIGESIDDAVGEAFDKVARMLGMNYPGGPHVSKAAAFGVENPLVKLPCPMLHSGDFKFSFSGLKTAVRYLIEKMKEQELFNQQMICDIAREFQNAVAEVLIAKTIKSIDKYQAQGLIIAGGVSANTFITQSFVEKLKNEYDILLYLPQKSLCGDNSLMIASAGFLNYWKYKVNNERKKDNLEYKKTATIPQEELIAVGNLKI